ncbi:hypothetical protein NUSPORA_01788 [Nucleospora cyclopteri]
MGNLNNEALLQIILYMKRSPKPKNIQIASAKKIKECFYDKRTIRLVIKDKKLILKKKFNTIKYNEHIVNPKKIRFNEIHRILMPIFSNRNKNINRFISPWIKYKGKQIEFKIKRKILIHSMRYKTNIS